MRAAAAVRWAPGARDGAALVVPTLIGELFGAGWGTAAAFGQIAFVAGRDVGDVHRRAALAAARPHPSRVPARWRASALHLRRASRSTTRSSASSAPTSSATTPPTSTHIAGRDSLTVLMAYAAVSERIRLGTGVLPIYSRTPVATAQQAATIDEYSSGRMVARARRVPPGDGRELVRRRARSSRCRRCASTSASCAPRFRGEDPPRRRDLPTATSASWDSSRAPTCPSTSPALSPKMLRARGRDRRRRDAVAVQSRVHPRGRGPRGARRAASRPASRSTASTSSPPCRPP